MSIKQFFDTRDIKDNLNRYVLAIHEMPTNNNFDKERNSKLLNMLGHFIREPTYWDERTQSSIESIGESFREHVASLTITRDALNLTFALSLRFVLEASLFGQSPDSTLPFKVMQDFAEYNIHHFDELSRSQIRYAIYEMPINVVRAFIANDEVNSYVQFIDALQKAKALQEVWIAELEEKKKRVEELNETLTKQKSAFNFVGLYAGFAKLGRIKAKELHWSRLAMFALGALMPVPLIYEFIYGGNLINPDVGVNGLIKIIPIASITLILIYYFRVALGNYNSVRAQVMQIELRKSLCRFIQSYADYAKELPRENTALLSKFEDVIFSNIMTSEEKTPSTFDGIEQLASLLSSIKGGKN